MKQEIFDSMNDVKLTPEKYLSIMFDRTDEDGILYIPGWHYDRPGWTCDADGSTDENDSYRCRVNWGESEDEKQLNYKKLLDKFLDVYNAIKHIARYWDNIEDDVDKAKRLLDEYTLSDCYLFDMWNTYVRPLDTGDYDLKKIEDIEDRLETVEMVKQIAASIAKGNSVEDFEKQAITEYIDISVTPDEIKYREGYLRQIRKDALNRIGNNICAYDVVIRARRLCKLMSLKAPMMIIHNESRQLAAAMLLHEYGTSRELVDNSIRLRLEQIELMSDEELDELYRPKKTNTRKSLAPLFVYDILTKRSNSKKHLRQQDILKELEKYPYEISLERKALSRIIHNLIDTSQYAVFSDKTGVWIEQERSQ